MQKAIFKPGLPDYITIETEEWKEILEGDRTTVRDVTVEFEDKEEGAAVSVTAETSRVRSLKLRWNTPLDKKSRILRTQGGEESAEEPSCPGISWPPAREG